MNESEEEISEEEYKKQKIEEKVEFIKKNFTLQQFLDFPITKKMILNDHEQKFIETAGKDIDTFYKSENYLYKEKLSNLFKFDDTANLGGGLISIIYNNIKKEYNLEMFYDTPYLANSLIKYTEDREKNIQKVNRIIPKKSTRIFNWKTKKYK